MNRFTVSGLVAAASLLATSNVALAAESTVQAPVATADAAAQDAKAAPVEKKICKQLDLSGSRLPRKACLTAKQWKQVEEENR
jgi:hypothetical protein